MIIIWICFYFTLLLSFVDCSSNISCDTFYLGQSGEGILTSYNYPFNYRENLTCTYTVYLPTGSNSTYTICLTFYRFSLESSTPFCYFDYLRVGGIKYCGSGLWQYGPQPAEPLANIWANNLCFPVVGPTFSIDFVSDNSVSGLGFYAQYNIYELSPTVPSMVQSGYAPCLGNNSWTCFNRQCISISQVCDRNNDCADGSDELYTHARCGVENLFFCDFSDPSARGSSSSSYCEFSNDGWFRTQEALVHGPDGDHTNGTGTGGFYMYAEYSDAAVANPAELVSPELSLPNQQYCLSFWFVIYGTDLSFSVFTSNELAFSRPEWQRTQSTKQQWTNGQLALSGGAKLQVFFVTKYSQGGSGGMALDDIAILNGPCTGMDVSCNFELNACGWTWNQSTLRYSGGFLSSNGRWTINGQGQGAGPGFDHSSVGGGGNYLFLQYNNTVGLGLSSTTTAILVSSPITISQVSDSQCFYLYYYGKDSAGGQSILHLHQVDSNNKLTTLWTSQHQDNPGWKLGYIQLTSSTPYKLVLEGSVYSGGQLAVDQLQLLEGSCTDIIQPTCSSGQFTCREGFCINATLRCNGVFDCADHSDEIGCPTTTTLVQCVIQCADKKLINCAQRCDGHVDCSSGQDEEGCSANTTTSTTTPVPLTCTMGQFMCKQPPECINKSLQCDGVAQCLDQSDEWNCTKCTTGQYQCVSSGSLLCLDSKHVCDGTADCSDGSDENKAGCPAAAVESTGLGPGGVVGICLGIVVLIIVIILLLLLLRRHHKQKEAHGPSHSNTGISTISYSSSAGVVSSRCPRSSSCRSEVLSYTSDGQIGAQALMSRSDDDSFPTDEAPPPYDSALKDGPLTSRNFQHLASTGSLGPSSMTQQNFNRLRQARRSDSGLLSRQERRQLADSIYTPRNYVPDPTEPLPSQARRGPLPIPPLNAQQTAVQPDRREHRGGVRLGTRSLPQRRNYLNQLPTGGYESDSTISNDHIYESLNPPSDTEAHSPHAINPPNRDPNNARENQTAGYPVATRMPLNRPQMARGPYQSQLVRPNQPIVKQSYFDARPQWPGGIPQDARHPYWPATDYRMAASHQGMFPSPRNTGMPGLRPNAMQNQHLRANSDISTMNDSCQSAFTPYSHVRTGSTGPQATLVNQSANNSNHRPNQDLFRAIPLQKTQLMAQENNDFQPVVPNHGRTDSNVSENRNLSTPDSNSRLLPSSNNSSFDHTHNQNNSTTPQSRTNGTVALLNGTTLQSTEI